MCWRRRGGVTWFWQDLTDTIVIAMAVGLNNRLGFWQEYKAEKGLEALTKVLTPKSKGGPGRGTGGDRCPPGGAGRCGYIGSGGKSHADGKIISADSLSLNEAILTGESQAVNKNRR